MHAIKGSAPENQPEDQEEVGSGVEAKLRIHACRYLNSIEVGIYVLLGLLLSVTALIALCNAGAQIWHTFWMSIQSGMAAPELREAVVTVDNLLYVLMLTEILHTVRISIHSHRLVTEPFLIVAIIASVRRMLVITLEGSSLTKVGEWRGDAADIFRASLEEMALLGGLVLVLVVAILLLRRYPGKDDED